MKNLLLVLIVVFLLRLPSLFEPLWYGDEAIYLVVAKALSQGQVLYRDIWDNKTPLLYLIYAINPVLWWAKLAATISVLGTCVGVYFLALKVTKKWANLTAFVTGIMLSIPLLEGTIANAELFFVLPIVWGGYLIFTGKRLWAAGVLAAIAFLIKVPAIFDFLGMFFFLAICWFEMLWNSGKPKVFVKAIFEVFWPIILGFIVPVILVFLYFSLNGALGDYLSAAFFQNSSYVAVGSGAFSNLANPLFVKGAVLLVLSALLAFLFLKKKISKELLFLGLWFGFSLFGALISNRPYMHYLLQIVPPAVLLLSYLILHIKKYFIGLIIFGVVLYFLMMDFEKAFRLHTIPYYRNFLLYASERKMWGDYVSYFDKAALANYKIAGYVKKNSNPMDSIFIWDDAAAIYYLSDRRPATKFIQAHHLTTVDPINYDLVIGNLNLEKPKHILIKEGSRFKFPKLNNYERSNYEEAAIINNLHIYELSVK